MATKQHYPDAPGSPPVEPKTSAGEPVQPARHAETPEDAKRMSGTSARDYVAGSPVNEEERAATEAEAARLAKSGADQRKYAEDQHARQEKEAEHAHKKETEHPHKK